MLIYEIIQCVRSLFFINEHVFHHLRLAIVLAIPTLNELKIKTNNSAAQGLTWLTVYNN